MKGYGQGYGTGLPNDFDYTDTELRMLEFYHDEQKAEEAHP